MPQETVRMVPNVITPNKPIRFNEEVCNGCNSCVDVCPMDVLVPNPEEGRSPVVLYPDECWYDGLCVINCPLWEKGAITLSHPLNQRVRWKRKETGGHFRLGMPHPPGPNTRPPVGGWRPKAEK